MNFMQFTYTKADHKASQRALYVTVSPNNMYEGVDISELSVEDQGLFIAENEAAKSDFLAEAARIRDKFDVKTMYRRFDPLKMTDVTKESV